jgi:hypothetical protein
MDRVVDHPQGLASDSEPLPHNGINGVSQSSFSHWTLPSHSEFFLFFLNAGNVHVNFFTFEVFNMSWAAAAASSDISRHRADQDQGRAARSRQKFKAPVQFFPQHSWGCTNIFVDRRKNNQNRVSLETRSSVRADSHTNWGNKILRFCPFKIILHLIIRMLDAASIRTVISLFICTVQCVSTRLTTDTCGTGVHCQKRSAALPKFCGNPLIFFLECRTTAKYSE